eukprot:scaffold1170_cov122-Cylindrotheca_fusiformis.AAC.26
MDEYFSNLFLEKRARPTTLVRDDAVLPACYRAVSFVPARKSKAVQTRFCSGRKDEIPRCPRRSPSPFTVPMPQTASQKTTLE